MNSGNSRHRKPVVEVAVAANPAAVVVPSVVGVVTTSRPPVRCAVMSILADVTVNDGICSFHYFSD